MPTKWDLTREPTVNQWILGYPISRQTQIGRLMLKFNGQELTRSMGSEIRTFQKRHVQKVLGFLRILIVIHPSSLLYTI